MMFSQPADSVAPLLLGATLVSCRDGETVKARITEVEAYRDDDPACHSYRGRTPRNNSMFADPGTLYTYFSYGVHVCANFVAHEPGASGGVLLRAATIVDGLEIARRRRGRSLPDAHLARGPGCLTVATGISLADNGTNLLNRTSSTHLVLHEPVSKYDSGPRVGVRENADIRWRFWLSEENSVSVYRRHPKAQRS